MKHRNIAKATILTVVILGMGTVFADNHNRHGVDGQGYHHRHGYLDGMLGDRGMKHLMVHAKEDFKVTEAQLDTLKEVLKTGRQQQNDHQNARRELMLEALALDPAAEDFDDRAAKLADRVAAVARDRALELTGVLEQLATVLTPEQIRKVQQVMEAGMALHNHHNGPKGGA